MAKEIERKFLVETNAWRDLVEGIFYRQGYLSTVKERTVRVRTVGNRGYLTIKGITKGFTRTEFEYEIPHKEADELLGELCLEPLIEKHRYILEHDGLRWEIDEFHGVNEGLILAEVELGSEDQVVMLPEWIGEEVSDDPRYFNANLIANPYTTWELPG